MSSHCIKDFQFEPRGNHEELVVLIHAYTHSPSRLNYVKKVITDNDQLINADILMPDINAGVYSYADPVKITYEILTKIDEYWSRNQYKRIILIGHSLGALLARKIYVYACGENPEAPFEFEKTPVDLLKPKEWAANVDRVILLAGMNRGWEISYHMSLLRTTAFSIGVFLGELLVLASRRKPLIFTIRKGSSFISNLRLQWLAMRNAETIQKKNGGDAQVIQLLGSIDDIVSPEDNIDLVTGRDFVYMDVPNSTHENIIEMGVSVKDKENNKKVEAANARKEKLEEALVFDKLKAKNLTATSQFFKAADLSVTDVVFVMHGIRDLGYWTEKIARHVQRKALSNGRVFAVETSSYGYFPLLPFLLPSKRRKVVEWFMDRYTGCKAQYPKARFHFVGHSNGTYLLAKALKEYPCCHFDNVVFAGSVVPTQYNWDEFKYNRRQVQSIMNYVATTDWVVALFPKAFEMLKIQDLGSAGHDGFVQVNPPYEIEYVRGRHDAALAEENWDDIAEFIVNNNIPISKSFEKGRSGWLVCLSKVAPLVWIAIASLLIFIGSLIINHPNWEEWFKTTVFIAYLWSIYLILTKF